MSVGRSACVSASRSISLFHVTYLKVSHSGPLPVFPVCSIDFLSFLIGKPYISFSTVMYDTWPEDSGEIKCEVHNATGMVSSVAILAVTEVDHEDDLAKKESKEVKTPQKEQEIPQEEMKDDLRRKPRFTKEPRNAHITEGETTRIPVCVEGNPAPIVKWYDEEDVEVLKEGRVRCEPDGSLVVEDADLNDEGEYLCVAENEAGEASSSIELLVDERTAEGPEVSEVISAQVRPVVEFAVAFPGEEPDQPDAERDRKDGEEPGKGFEITGLDDLDDELHIVKEDVKPKFENIEPVEEFPVLEERKEPGELRISLEKDEPEERGPVTEQPNATELTIEQKKPAVELSFVLPQEQASEPEKPFKKLEVPNEITEVTLQQKQPFVEMEFRVPVEKPEKATDEEAEEVKKTFEMAAPVKLEPKEITEVNLDQKRPSVEVEFKVPLAKSDESEEESEKEPTPEKTFEEAAPVKLEPSGITEVTLDQNRPSVELEFKIPLEEAEEESETGTDEEFEEQTAPKKTIEKALPVKLEPSEITEITLDRKYPSAEFTFVLPKEKPETEREESREESEKTIEAGAPVKLDREPEEEGVSLVDSQFRVVEIKLDKSQPIVELALPLSNEKQPEVNPESQRTFEVAEPVMIVEEPQVEEEPDASAEGRRAEEGRIFPPEFTDKLHEVETTEGATASFFATVSGKPRPEIQWFKDGKPFREDERTELEENPDGSLKLTISDATLDDEGDYKCVATNRAGEAATSAELLVEEKLEKPIFLEQLKDLEVLEGSDVRLEVRVKGTEPEVDWFKDGEVMTESSERTEFVENEERGSYAFLIYCAVPEDQGSYMCVAANDAGKASCQGELTVRVETLAPRFLQRLESTEVIQGSDIDLEVEVTGKPKPTVEWFRDGERIQPSERLVMESEGRVHTLSIQKAELDDEAEYKCVASNSAGQTFCTAMLLLEEEMKGPEFTTVPEGVEIIEGSAARFEAVVAGIPEPDIEWLKDDKPIKEGHRFKLSFDQNRSVLRVLDAELTDEGEYTCTASNKVGKCSCTVELVVEEAIVRPAFVKRLSSVELFQGDLARLEVRVSGTPEPEVAWSKDKDPVEEGERYEVLSDDDMHCLSIRDCVLSDSGRYKCTASNEAGEISCLAELNVMEKPESLQFSDADKEMPFHVDEAGNITLEATVTGRPRPEVEWHKDDTPITQSAHYDVQVDGDQNRLTIVAASPGDSGTYKCEAKNEFDTVSRIFNIDIEGRMVQLCLCIRSPNINSNCNHFVACEL